MGLRLFGLDNVGAGVDAAMDYLTEARKA